MTSMRKLLWVLFAVAALVCVAPSTTHADRYGYGWGRYGYRSYYRPYAYGYRSYYRPYAYRPYYGYSVAPGYAVRAYSYSYPYAYRPYYSYRTYYAPSFPVYYGPTYGGYYGGFGPYYGGPYGGGYFRGPSVGFFVY